MGKRMKAAGFAAASLLRIVALWVLFYSLLLCAGYVLFSLVHAFLRFLIELCGVQAEVAGEASALIIVSTVAAAVVVAIAAATVYLVFDFIRGKYREYLVTDALKEGGGDEV